MKHLSLFHDANQCVFSRALIVEQQAHQIDSNRHSPSIELLTTLNTYLQWTGIHNPYQKVYVKAKNEYSFAQFLFVFVAGHISKLQYVRNLSTFTGRKAEQIDGAAFVIGMVTLLKQFHIDIMSAFIEHVAQYIISFTEFNLT